MRQQDGRWAERLRRVAADERVARHAGFWWGFAEGVVFFIVPDVYITAAALFSYRAGAVAWAASIAGSLVAVAIVRVMMLLPGVGYLAWLDAVPGISAGMIDRVSAAVGAGGLPWTPLLVLGGVPLKLYAAAAFASGLSLGAVLLWTVFARVARIAPTFLVAALVRRLFRRRIDAHPGAWLAALALFWLAFYAFYFQRMGGD
ncbi:MAG TPA: hypothetical protein VHG35_08625 [Gemmatimonadales bacterium]|nr:hypothetical protein [Gemmatimonadales bacterium]